MSRSFVRWSDEDLKRAGVKLRRGARLLRPRSCPDCGAVGERKGHQSCEYPSD